jgi:hypothetical protein
MTEPDLLQALSRGEDSRHEFKRDATNADGMAAKPLMRGHAKQKTDEL